jgi:hypothetical protein
VILCSAKVSVHRGVIAYEWNVLASYFQCVHRCWRDPLRIASVRLASPEANGAPVIIIDASGAELASLFVGLAPHDASFQPSPVARAPRPRDCHGQTKNPPALRDPLLNNLKAAGQKLAPPQTCQGTTDCTGECICVYPIGSACCSNTSNFRYDCDECEGFGEQDTYHSCNGSCCWSARGCLNQ